MKPVGKRGMETMATLQYRTILNCMVAALIEGRFNITRHSSQDMERLFLQIQFYKVYR